MYFFILFNRKFSKLFAIISSIILFYSLMISQLYALPVDMSGTIGLSTDMIENYRKTSDIIESPNDGSQYLPATPGKYKRASFQSYKFKLNPSVIINDSATFFSELTTGYGYGGQLGESPSQRKEGNSTFATPLYLHNHVAKDSNLILSQFYLQLFSDVATYKLGRHSSHWGLGVLYNDGSASWDRHATIRDGITMDFKISGLKFSPFYSKINSNSTLTKEDNTKVYGISVLYDQIESDLTFGILLAKQRTESQNSTYVSNHSGEMIGPSQVKITDLFLKKKFFKKLTTAVEVPILSGTMKNLYTAGDAPKYKANAIITESVYNFNESWTAGLKLGQVSGDDGQGPNYEAFYLHPNYQVANIMFRYNFRAVNDQNQSIYDSYMVNTKYLKLYGNYKNESWIWDAAVIMGWANEVGKTGQKGLNHERNIVYEANFDQKKDLGTELDFGLLYKWNANIEIIGQFGYHFVGDYFSYNNDSKTLKSHNTYMGRFGLIANF